MSRGSVSERLAFVRRPSGQRLPLRSLATLRLPAALALVLAGGPVACDAPAADLSTGPALRPDAGASGAVRAPEVRIRAPEDGATVSGTVTIEVEAKERDADLAGTDVFIDGEVVMTSSAERFTHSWSTEGLSGSHTIAATTSDVEGNTASASVTVTVQSSGDEPPPSGDGPGVLSVAVNPNMVTAGDSSVGTVGLTDFAPAGGVEVALASADPGVAQVPPSVTVAAGESVARFPVTTSAVSASADVAISASAGGSSASTTLTVTPATAGGGTLDALTIEPDLVVGGESAQGTVTLAAAVEEDTPVTLTSSDEAVATVPATVTVPAGQVSAGFEVQTAPVSGNEAQFAHISGHAGGVTRGASITTTAPPSGPAVASVSFHIDRVGGGGPVTGTVTMTGPANDAARVFLTSSDPDVVQVPDELVVSAGASAVDFPVTTSPVAADREVTVTATACCGGVGEASGTVTVTTDAPPPPDVVAIDRARVKFANSGAWTLEVRASSTSTSAILTVFRAGTETALFRLTHQGGGRYQGSGSFSGAIPPPDAVEVRSNLGGEDTANVR